MINRFTMVLRLLTIIVCVFITLSAAAQKVKYKDIFEFIEKEQYDESDQLLIDFLKNPKNSDHANANFQMGKMYMRNLVKLHLFKKWDVIQQYTDSALHYMDLSKKLIDEKEIKKNDVYYAEFEQRDIRTGKKTIKVFDIHFEIDDKINWLTERAKQVELVNGQAKKLQSDYEDLQERFSDFLKEKHSIPELYLQAGLGTIAQLESLGEAYSGLLTEANQYTQNVKSIPSSELIIALVENNIEDPFEVELTSVDFTADIVKLWNFHQWSEKTRTNIVSDILPLKNELIQYDQEISGRLERLKSGQMIDSKFLNDQKISELAKKLGPFDQDPLPIHMFKLKLMESKYHSLVLKQPDPLEVDNLGRRMDFTSERNELLKLLLEEINIISDLNIDLQIRNYSGYVNSQYKGFAGLESYLKNIKSFAESKNKEFHRELTSLSERNKYMLAKGETRIPVDSTAEFPNNIFEPLEIKSGYSSGLFQIGSILSAYWVEINSSRSTDEFYTISLEEFSGSKPQNVLSQSDPSGRYFYLVFFAGLSADPSEGTNDSTVIESNSEVLPAYFVKIERTSGVVWKKEIQLPKYPVSLQLTQANGLLVNFDDDFIEIKENGELVGN